MKKVFIVILLLFAYSSLSAQFHYYLSSTPDSAIVKLNGKIIGHTPLNVKYRWINAKDGKLDFSMTYPGYETWHMLVNEKPREFDRTSNISLKRELPVLNIDPESAMIAFDNIVADFTDGRKVGEYKNAQGNVEVLKWDGNIKVGDTEYEDLFNNIVTNAGFNTSIREGAKLFSNTKTQSRLPRFVVGVELVDCDISLVENSKANYGDGLIIGRTRVNLNWKVLDRTSSKVVYSYENIGVCRYRSSYAHVANIAIAFEDALVDFIKNGELKELVEGAEVTSLDAVNENNSEIISISKSTLPIFKSNSEMIKYTNKSCVTVITDGGHGSGVVIDEKGYVLTAYHVVDGVNRIEVKFSSGLTQDAILLSYDRYQDVALLDISGSGYQALPLGDSDDISLGEEVLTIGAPASIELGQSISKGILSGKRKYENQVFLQTDLAVSPGNSGGPLLNTKGEIIGIIQRKLVEEGVEGIGFALPIDVAIKQLNLIVK